VLEKRGLSTGWLHTSGGFWEPSMTVSGGQKAGEENVKVRVEITTAKKENLGGTHKLKYHRTESRENG